MISPVGHTLYDTDMLIASNKGLAPKTMTSFRSLLRRVGEPPAAVADAPAELPPVDASLLERAGECYVDGGTVPTLADLGLHLDLDFTSPFKV